MRLLEAVIDANHRALSGDPKAGLHPAEYESSLPVVALTCIDARLNPLIPEVLGIPEEQFIWSRNAGNIITGPMSSTMRSLALACAVKGGREILIIGHTDCQVGKLSTMDLLERFKRMGVERHAMPDNISQFFGIFSSPRANVIQSTTIARSSPLIGPQVPIHGVLVDLQTGKLDWLVNGYDTLGTTGPRWNEVVQSANETLGALKSLTDFSIGGIHIPDTKIGEAVSHAESWVSRKLDELQVATPVDASPLPPAPAPGSPPVPPKIPLPPPIRPRIHLRKR